MKTRPILLNGDMVRAVLNGSKTQTRRIVKPDWVQSRKLPLECGDGIFHFWCSGEHSCPFGQVGDRLWVREAWSVHKNYDTLKPALVNVAMGGDTRYCINYHAMKRDGNIWGKTRPSIHMPRWASRITLEITSVRVERLQDISEEDAKVEGVEALGRNIFRNYKDPENCPYYLSPVSSFVSLWNSIYGTWEKNPWVWVIEFKVVQ